MQELKDSLAVLMHKFWCTHTQQVMPYLNCPAPVKQNWIRLMMTKYECLTESEKNEARAKADEIINLLEDLGIS